MLEISSTSPDILYVNQTQIYGGIKYNISVSYELTEMLHWYRTHLAQTQKELEARKKYESVASAYDQYQTTLKLATSDEIASS